MTVNEPRWKQIEGFPEYWVDDSGRVYNLKYRRYMNTCWRGNFEYVSLTRDQKTFNRGVEKILSDHHPKTMFINFDRELEFRKVVGFPQYVVNWKGVVVDTKNGKELTHYLTAKGSPFVRLINKRGAHSRGIRTLVLKAFKIKDIDGKQLRPIRMAKDSKLSGI